MRKEPQPYRALPDVSCTFNAVAASDAATASDAVVIVDPPGNAFDAMLSHSVDIVFTLVKPTSATANKRKKTAAAEQKYGPIEVKLSTGFDSAWVALAKLLDQPADVFDISSAEWHFMRPANSAHYPLRDAKAFSFLAKWVHSRATLKTPKNANILIYVRLQSAWMQRQVCFSQFHIIELYNNDGTGLSS